MQIGSGDSSHKNQPSIPFVNCGRTLLIKIVIWTSHLIVTAHNGTVHEVFSHHNLCTGQFDTNFVCTAAICCILPGARNQIDFLKGGK